MENDYIGWESSFPVERDEHRTSNETFRMVAGYVAYVALTGVAALLGLILLFGGEK